MAVPWLTLGCPPVEEYLTAREMPATYNPIDVAGFAKIVFDVDNKNVVVHWSDGTHATFGDDKRVMVSGTDTTPDYLSLKLQAGYGIELAIANSGANEQLRISNTDGGFFMGFLLGG